MIIKCIILTEQFFIVFGNSPMFYSSVNYTCTAKDLYSIVFWWLGLNKQKNLIFMKLFIFHKLQKNSLIILKTKIHSLDSYLIIVFMFFNWFITCNVGVIEIVINFKWVCKEQFNW